MSHFLPTCLSQVCSNDLPILYTLILCFFNLRELLQFKGFFSLISTAILSIFSAFTLPLFVFLTIIPLSFFMALLVRKLLTLSATLKFWTFLPQPQLIFSLECHLIARLNNPFMLFCALKWESFLSIFLIIHKLL